MIDQILTGINNAIDNHDLNRRSALHDLSDADIMDLATSVLAALAVVPENTPDPVVAMSPTMPVLVISPADVIAAAADAALLDAERERTQMSQYVEDSMITQTLIAGDDYREVREFIFRIQSMFGVRVRSPRPVNGNPPSFLIAGSDAQIRAFQRTLTMIHTLAAPVVVNMDSDERREFWATLGDLCADVDTADHLIESNRAAYDAATVELNIEFGTVRNLRRTAPVTSGAVFDSACAVLVASEQS